MTLSGPPRGGWTDDPLAAAKPAVKTPAALIRRGFFAPWVELDGVPAPGPTCARAWLPFMVLVLEGGFGRHAGFGSSRFFFRLQMVLMRVSFEPNESAAQQGALPYALSIFVFLLRPRGFRLQTG